MKKNESGKEKVVDIFLTETQHPIAYKAKLEELIECGMSEEESRHYISTTTIQMELYYSKNKGLFMVESEAVEAIEITNPYTGELLEEIEEE